MVAASSDEPSPNPSSEPSLVPSIQSKLRAIFEAICDVALLHPNEPSGTPFSGTRCRTGYWLAIQVNFLFFLSMVLTISCCIRRLSQESVQWSRAWGRIFGISFSLQLLISWLAPSRRLDLTNGLVGIIQRCGTLLLPGLVETY
jgi:hypothetical protein